MIKQYGLHKCLQFGLASLLGWFIVSIFTAKAQAQQSNIVPDNTLGAESSKVIGNFQGQPIEVITGGATRQINLFHSFQEFNISEGRAAYFFSPSADIQNILARVTGSNPSAILGALGTFGRSSPNLFLINPNGIVFGKNASLDVQGSFVATTANGVQFGNQGVFSATNPEAAPMLTINPSALFFNQIQENAAITNQSQAAAGKNSIGQDVTGLRVPDGKSLLLVGGNVNINGGELKVFGGNIDLAGLSAPGNVGLNFRDNNLSLTIPDGVERADVSLTNGAVANVRNDNGGNIKISARNVELAGESILRAGIDIGLGTPESQGGDVVIDATGITTLTQGSFIANLLQPEAFGKTGEIKINTGSLNFDNAQLNVTNNGQGSGGNIFLQVKDRISLTNGSAIFGGVENTAIGNSGNIQIEAGSLSLTNSQIDSRTFGQGNAGNITINVREAINLNGRGGNDRTTNIVSVAANYEGVGNAGDIQIKTGSLRLRDGAFISNSTVGKGNAGNITIDARDHITFENASSARSGTSQESVGNGGEIRITTETLSLSGGSQIKNNILGQGNSGDITINARDSIKLDGIVGNKLDGIVVNSISGITSEASSENAGKGGNIQVTTGSLSLTNGATLSTMSIGKGNSGNITINAQDTVTVDGFGKTLFESGQVLQNPLAFSKVSSSSLSNTGNSGNIRINTRNLLLNNGGRINSDAYGSTNAGNIFIQAEDTVSISSQKYSAFSSAITSAFGDIILGGTGQGNSGNINIQTGKFSLSNSFLNATTIGRGNAGNISVDVQNSASLINSRIYSTVEPDAVGNGGNIDFKATTLSLDNSRLSSVTNGVGNAGNISMQATESITFKNGAQIQTSTLGQGDAGNVKVTAGAKVSFDGFNSNGFKSGISSTVGTKNEPFGTGKGGNIGITARDLFVTNNAEISSSSFAEGNAGDIFINSGLVQLDNNGKIAAVTNSKNGGNINLTATDLLLLRRNSSISTTAGLAQGGGDGGNMNINAKFIIAIPKENSDISANAFQGRGGNVEINSQGIFGIESRPKPTEKSDITASSELGVSGVININVPDTSSIQNSFAELPPAIDTNALIAQSCISRGNKRQENSFMITGSGALNPNRPGVMVSTYTTGDVRGVETTSHPWKKGDPIIEPQGLYRLDNGQLLLSRECS